MAADHICIGIKDNGERCTKRSLVGQHRCGVHMKKIERWGPNSTEVLELKSRHKKAVRELGELGLQQMRDAGDDAQRVNDIAEDNLHQLTILKANQKREVELLERTHRNRIRETGIDPDAPARERRRLEELEANRRWAERRRVELEMNGNQDFERVQDVILRAIQANRPVVNRQAGELQQFARDNQNVHRERTVNLTKDMVTLILTIPVPDEYKWNMTECSKTPGEIAMVCRLTPKAAWQMFSKYCQDESIYELGKGVYGKVLDGVWQYILSSPDKTDLCRVLKQEMEDNVGMCAQGNLSRLCNILAGYLEGIGSQESIADILGRLLPGLMEIGDIDTRLSEACKILKENKVPYSQWKSWVEPLLGDQDVDMKVGFLYNEQQDVTGIVAVVG
jgi:hypothetical protein